MQIKEIILRHFFAETISSTLYHGPARIHRPTASQANPMKECSRTASYRFLATLSYNPFRFHLHPSMTGVLGLNGNGLKCGTVAKRILSYN